MCNRKCNKVSHSSRIYVSKGFSFAAEQLAGDVALLYIVTVSCWHNMYSTWYVQLYMCVVRSPTCLVHGVTILTSTTFHTN